MKRIPVKSKALDNYLSSKNFVDQKLKDDSL